MEVEIRTSGIWQLSSVVLTSRGESVVIDPAYFPRELDELRAVADARGSVAAVVFTHGHWDHVIGWRTFPEAPVRASAGLVDAVRSGSEVARRNLADARQFDGEWYVPRPGPYEWPKELA